MAERNFTTRWPADCRTILLIALLATGCDKASPVAPTTPSPDPSTQTPPPSPAVSQITLTGRITEAPPTTWTGVEGAMFTITDGANTGRSVKADLDGYFTLAGLTPGPIRATATAEGYVPASLTLDGSRDTTASVQLLPNPQTITNTITGDLASTGGTCSDGIADRPCQIIAMPIHNNGPTDATLTWTGSSDVALTVTLFQTGASTPIARSSAAGTNSQHISAMLTGGQDYEFRITVVGGTGSASYTLRVTHQN
jgi:Carboxypeptidase regulatory-like domain